MQSEYEYARAMATEIASPVRLRFHEEAERWVPIVRCVEPSIDGESRLALQREDSSSHAPATMVDQFCRLAALP